jgi:CYTH domain-containing protein/thymidylate kinase
MHSIYRIVLTGGPCGGKSTAIPHISDHLKSLGLDVYTVPEAATLLFSNGCSLTNPSIDQVFNFENNLMLLQQSLEDKFYNIAKSTMRPSVIICDRGMMDGSTYVSNDIWQAILSENKWSIVDIRDRRYDAVIHLITAADGATQFYTTENNKARTETPKQAVDIDNKLKDAWVGHPHLRIIDNSTDFKGKIDRTIKAISRVIGIPEPIEIEKRFLVHTDAIIPVRSEEVDIVQVYLKTDDGTMSRIRRRGCDQSYIYTHTIKKSTGVSGKSIEIERRISENEYLALLMNADLDRRSILKKRTCFLWNNQYYEFDRFASPYGLSILEIELDTESDNITIPPFISVIKDITGDKSYSNRSLAAIP